MIVSLLSILACIDIVVFALTLALTMLTLANVEAKTTRQLAQQAK